MVRANCNNEQVQFDDFMITKRFTFYWNWSVVGSQLLHATSNLYYPWGIFRKWAQRQAISLKSGDVKQFKSINYSARIEINFNNKRSYRKRQSNNIIKQRWWSVLMQKKMFLPQVYNLIFRLIFFFFWKSLWLYGMTWVSVVQINKANSFIHSFSCVCARRVCEHQIPQ